MINQQIKSDLVAAMKAKNSVKANTLKAVKTAFTNENVANKRKPDEELNDEDALKVISRLAKQRKDSIEQFEKGGRTELAETEKLELAILEQYLPEQMSEEEVMKVVLAKKEELGISDKSQMGKFMGAVMAELKGKADGNVVKSAVDKALS